VRLVREGRDPVPGQVIGAVRTCRMTIQDEIGIDLSLERRATLADHCQCALWVDIALKRKTGSSLELGKTVANNQTEGCGQIIGASGGHVLRISATVIAIKGLGRVGGRSDRRGGGLGQRRVAAAVVVAWRKPRPRSAIPRSSCFIWSSPEKCADGSSVS